ncbi:MULTISPECIES: hypothetical protein [Pseudomonas]|uniref:hypothetical protein n=1 Tax=Pseudomonas nitroreducens TaxID=46680 RepID=UPI001E4E7CCF|nr:MULTISPECIES: hypothetical protein [Pseudomonas]MCE4069875.1 hypothetical protein [Pseudomonas nitritireducens]MCE4078480.1 hypothetical protein [Pseudomonas nitroreducens]
MDMQATDVQEDDAFDRYVNLAGTYFRRYVRHLIRWLPPAVGFLLFLAYFVSNHFYPSFDLFQFSSLLLSAAAIGFIFVGALTVGVATPGVLLVHWFAKDKRYQGLLRQREGTEQQKDRDALWLLLLCFVLPCSLTAVSGSLLILSVGANSILLHFLPPTLIALIFGVALQVWFGLPKWSFLHFLTAAITPLLAVTALALAVLASTSTLTFIPANYQPIAIVSIMLLVGVLVGFIAPTSFAGITATLSFAVPLALAFAFYSGALTSMPERVMNWLGLGNYQATEIALDPAFCEQHAPERLKLDKLCAMKDVHVVWSLGETFVIRIHGSREIQAQIPTRYVKAVIRTVN